jgi:hypothetical protein
LFNFASYSDPAIEKFQGVKSGSCMHDHYLIANLDEPCKASL